MWVARTLKNVRGWFYFQVSFFTTLKDENFWKNFEENFNPFLSVQPLEIIMQDFA